MQGVRDHYPGLGLACLLAYLGLGPSRSCAFILVDNVHQGAYTQEEHVQVQGMYNSTVTLFAYLWVCTWVVSTFIIELYFPDLP